MHLAIPHYREAGLNLSVAGQNADTRYLAGVETVRDETSQQSEKPIQIARKNIRLLVEEETSQGTSTLGIARISQDRGGRLPARPAVRAPPAGHLRQRLFGLHRPAAGGDPLGPQQRARRDAPPEEPEPGGVHLGRYRQLLAALHDQHAPAAPAPHLRAQARPSRGALFADALAGRRADHLLAPGPPARSAGLRSRRSGDLFLGTRRETAVPAGDGGPVQLRFPPAQAGAPVDLRDRDSTKTSTSSTPRCTWP